MRYIDSASPFLPHLTPRQFQRHAYAVVGYPLLLLFLSLSLSLSLSPLSLSFRCPIILGINYLQNSESSVSMAMAKPMSVEVISVVDIPISIPGLGPLELFQPQTHTAFMPGF